MTETFPGDFYHFSHTEAAILVHSPMRIFSRAVMYLGLLMNFQLPPQILNRIEVQRLARSLQNLGMLYTSLKSY